MSILNPSIAGLAGLLSDLGKLYQLAEKGPAAYVPEDCLQWTQKFVEENKDLFVRWGFPSQLTAGLTLKDLVSSSASSEKPEQALLAMARQWAIGSVQVTRSGIPQLTSVFARLKTSVGEGKGDAFYPARPLSIGDAVFPCTQEEAIRASNYKELWQGFLSELKWINSSDPEAAVFSLFHLLKKYTSFLPALPAGNTEISSFEASKITASLAHSLITYYGAHPEILEPDPAQSWKLKADFYPFLLVCGDISGIQAFLYNIANKSAAKSLKGRSFYIQLLADTIARELMTTCGANIYSIVYTAGGKFYLLLANTTGVKDALAAYQEKIEERLWAQFEGRLSVNIAHIAFTFNGAGLVSNDKPGEILTVGDLWKELAEKTSLAKRQRYRKLMINQYESLFEAHGTGGNTRICAITGQELEGSEAVILDEPEVQSSDEATTFISRMVDEQIKLGRQLVGARSIAIAKEQLGKGFKPGLTNNWFISENMYNSPDDAKGCISYSIDFNDKLDFLPGNNSSNNIGYGFRLYGGIRSATVKGIKRDELKTFEELATIGEQQDRLGVLRMDVDNLGQLFMSGFPPERRSFAALATLSAALELFFSGHLNVIRNMEKYRDNVNIIYSGGDDVFAVGHWNLILDFAIETRNAFRRYVAGRDDLTISGGIAIVRPKFPIAKAAELAGEAEDAAKMHVIKTGDITFEKDSINLFGTSLNCTQELPFVLAFRDDLVYWIREKNYVSKGLLMKFFEYYEQYKQNKIQWRWQAAYALSRYEKQRDDMEHRQVFDWLKKLVFTGNYRNQYKGISFEAIIVACRWAELLIKKSKS
ncbi:type III-A CRISPR-associated protein Cas10/Csm1 [Flavihumibacter profundi]|uniref:type III-A CRISPR-associated protein Cas10/Csm1 n=1 Tax=Flavihumibacter profundi TaxID=2716883 RepID=UPI001CC3B103|nr:type III-A CRISPR-associated protein Cas10/Csm1 [Flavihumibacter profundi]MBZ5857560.1 type III-A CRISPR-associated protein Cas10/Csm1 [Flavihumibacter profundi]